MGILIRKTKSKFVELVYKLIAVIHFDSNSTNLPPTNVETSWRFLI